MSALLIAAALVFVCAGPAIAQKRKKPAKAVPVANKNLPMVTQIGEAEFKAILKKSTDAGRPVLVNFWATWCDPCREEFPDLVKMETDFGPRGLDLIVVSMDDLPDLKTTVPKFVGEMKLKTPSYLLSVNDEAAFLEMVTAAGNVQEAAVGLPVTVLFDGSGKVVYKKSGKFKTEVLRAEVEKILK
jgi:thiol-disulfide isomerase/thioredoxin